MKDQIKEFIHRRNEVSFPELMRAVPDSAGERMLCHENHPNLVLWKSMSQPFADAIQLLLSEGEIVFRPIRGLEVFTVHAADRGFLDYPVAKRIKNYATEHWLPVVICRA